MKILFLSDKFFPQQTTTGKIVSNLGRVMKLLGHEVFIITATQEKENEGEAEIAGFKVYRIYSNYHERWRAYLSLYNPRTVGKIKRIISKIRPDVVYAHNIHYHLSYYSLKLAKKSGAKVFLTAHDVQLFHYGKLTEVNYKVSVWQQIKKAGKTYNPFRNIIIRHYLKYADKIFAVSGALKDALNDNGIKNVEVIHNGIDVAEWTVNEKIIIDFKGKYNLSGKKIILFGGRLSELKGGEQIISAMREIIKKANNAVLIILGNREGYARTLLDSAKQKGLGNNIVFTGWLSGNELKAAFNSADIIAVPSICFDSFPTVILEAMACKKPIVATCFGGAKEMVLDGETGYIVNPFNIEEMAGKIIYLLKNQSEASRLGENGYIRVKTEFNLEIRAQRLIMKYKN